jgi:hypothetical protein
MSAKWAALLGASASTSTPAADPQAGAASSSAAATAASIHATAAAAAPVPKPLVFEYEKHVAYFSMHLRSIPQGYEGLVRGAHPHKRMQKLADTQTHCAIFIRSREMCGL